MLEFLLILIGLSALVVVHEFGHFLFAKLSGLLVEEFGVGFPPRLISKKIGETLYSFNAIPIGGFVRIYGETHGDERQNTPENRSFSHQSVGRRFWIVAAGILFNFLLGWFLLSAVFLVGIPEFVAITEVKSGSLAEQSGLQSGDVFLDFKTVEDLVGYVDSHRGVPGEFKVRRGSEELKINLTPRADVPAKEGNLGIYLVNGGLPKMNFLPALKEGLFSSIKIMVGIAKGLVSLLAGLLFHPSLLDNFVGPVGIVNVALETTRLGIAHFLQLLAMISLNLAVFNLFPIPALDGGRLLFLLIEKIRGRALEFKTEALVNSLGMALLLFLILAVTIKDLLTLL